MLFKTKNSDDVWTLVSANDKWETEIKNTRTKEYKIINTKDFNKWVATGAIKAI